jgi:hypothetical protein
MKLKKCILSIYFEVTDAEVEFIRASAESDTGGLL